MGNSFTRRLLHVVAMAAAIILFTGFAAAATGLAGKWSGTVDVHDASSGTTVSTPIELQLEQSQAGELSGKIGREGETDTVPISNGKLDGDRVTFEAASSETSGAMKFTLVLAGDHLEGQIKGAVEALQIEGKVKLNREKN